MLLDIVGDSLEDLGYPLHDIETFLDVTVNDVFSVRSLLQQCMVVNEILTLQRTSIPPVILSVLANPSMLSSDINTLHNTVYALYMFYSMQKCPYMVLFSSASITQTNKVFFDNLSLDLTPEINTLIIDWLLSELMYIRISCAQKDSVDHGKMTDSSDDSLQGATEISDRIQPPPLHLSITQQVALLLGKIYHALLNKRSLSEYVPISVITDITRIIKDTLARSDVPSSFVLPPLLASHLFSHTEKRVFAEITHHFDMDYAIRKRMLVQRLTVTLQSFLWKCDRDTVDILIKIINTKINNLNIHTKITLDDVYAAGINVAHLPVVSNSLLAHTNNRVKQVIIAPVPDRGGRTNAKQNAVKLPGLKNDSKENQQYHRQRQLDKHKRDRLQKNQLQDRVGPAEWKRMKMAEQETKANVDKNKVAAVNASAELEIKGKSKGQEGKHNQHDKTNSNTTTNVNVNVNNSQNINNTNNAKKNKNNNNTSNVSNVNAISTPDPVVKRDSDTPENNNRGGKGGRGGRGRGGRGRAQQ